MPIPISLTTKGRISRSVFWYTQLACIGAIYALNALSNAWADIADIVLEYNATFLAIEGLIVFPMTVFLLWCHCVSVAKRFHDLNMSAWWTLFVWIPAVGWLVYLVVLGCFSGTCGNNRYGAPAPPCRFYQYKVP